MSDDQQAEIVGPTTMFGPWVQGKCPACGAYALFVGSGGYLTCSYLTCPRPESPSEALGVTFPQRDNMPGLPEGGEDRG